MIQFYREMLGENASNERSAYIKWFATYREDRTYLKRVFKVTVEKLLSQPFLLAAFLDAVAGQWGFE